MSDRLGTMTIASVWTAPLAVLVMGGSVVVMSVVGLVALASVRRA